MRLALEMPKTPLYCPECSSCRQSLYSTVTTAKHETCSFLRLHQGHVLAKRRSQIPQWCPSRTLRIRQALEGSAYQFSL
ncbi:hypothetical protein BGW80DRAFT_1370054, partial [Lactifluus volemus]